MGRPDLRDQLVLLVLKALSPGFGVDHVDEEVADLGGNSAVVFSRSDPSAIVELVVH